MSMRSDGDRMDLSIYRAVFEASPNPYMVLDRELRFVAANPAYLRATGTTIEALLGRHLFEAFPHDPHDPRNDNARLLRESLERVLASRAPDVIAVIPYRVPRERDGQVVLEERFWSATHTPIPDDAGDVRLILQHTVDVTDLQEMQDAPDRRRESGVLQRAQRVQEANYTLDAERQHLRRLFDQAPGFVAVLSGPDHVFDLVNAAYRRLIGDRDVIGKPVRQALPEVADQGFFQVLDQVFATGQPFVGRGVHIRLERQAGGGLDDVFVDFVYQPIFDGPGAVTGIFVQGHDITAEKHLEAERESLLEQQRFLTESIPQHVWTADAAGHLTSANMRILEYFGVAADRIVGSGWQQFVQEEDLQRSVDRWNHAVASGDDYETEFRLRRADGTYRWHLGRAVAMRGAKGAVARWFGTNTDIDDRKRAQDELQMHAAYERQLIGIVSHDLRNPITAIAVAAALLGKQDQLNPSQTRAVSRIVSSSDRARRMLRDFLDFTQARTLGRIPVVPGPANLEQIARQTFEELRVLHPGRLATIENDGDTGGTWDADRIAQVIGNLLSNAYQHSPESAAIQLRTRGTPSDVVIEVFNEGAPIPAADAARLFEPFERGEGAPSADRSVGLGLFISSQIVEAHGGTISVESKGDGTVFRVRLPRLTPTTAEPPGHA
jgi:PAS domain S-box-containing protein